MIDIINYVISSIGSLITVFLNMLPNSPFQYIETIDISWIKWINYILPISQCVAVLENYLIAVTTYYIIRVVLRWIKVASA